MKLQHLNLIIFAIASFFSQSTHADALSGKTLWDNLTRTMMQQHGINISVSFCELPAWIPLESFNFFNTIFVNPAIKNDSLDAQKAIIGHELSHIIAGHSSKQLALFFAGTLALVYVLKKGFQTQLLNSLSTSSKTLIACISTYAAYYLFNAYYVYSHELEAEALNVLFLGNGKVVLERLQKIIAQEEATKLAPSWFEKILRFILPCFPSAQETLHHIAAHSA